MTEPIAKPHLPHIRLKRAYWEIVKNRTTHSHIIMGCTSKFSSLNRIGPWRPIEAVEWYGDTKKPI
jgi:hypothetical protein